MPLSWNEIRSRAVTFSRDWADTHRERAEAQTFWNEFFNVFGIKRRTVASFEEPVRNLDGRYGFIDLFWKGTLIAEHKSRGGDLGRAHLQANGYLQDLHNDGRGAEIPRYVVASDFARLALHDLESGERPLVVELAELHQHIHAFGFLAGYRTAAAAEQDPINLKAVRVMGDLHDALEAGGYRGHDLERLLVRVLFCLFAEDTGIFEPAAFQLYLEHHTAEDGSDLGMHLARLFQVLNTPKSRRQANLLEELADLPYVNGDLFAEQLGFADFNREMRNALLGCTRFHWQHISPAIFGSMFQSVMEPRERRQVGGHYTSEKDILKLVRSLFLDALEIELQAAGRDRRKLEKYRQKLGEIRVLDPACGCGNFLVIAYRELRRLEIEALESLYAGRQRQQSLDLRQQMRVDVDQLYGIEIQEWPARIAEVALWLMDHQMNQLASEKFGQYILRLPLEKSPTIVHENALRIDWNDVIPEERCSYVLGNPPFVGAKFLTVEQKEDLRRVVPNLRNRGLLDYVAGWYFKVTGYFKRTEIRAAFVSTNSITQGEQVGVLWQELYKRGLHIHFGHRTFSWESEAEGRAHVHVVIIGFGTADPPGKRIYDYETGAGDNGAVSKAATISPYLIEGGETVVTNRSRPLCDVPEIGIGNKPIDGGHYLFTPEEKNAFLQKEPAAEKYFRRWLGSREFINSIERWCLWLGDCSPSELRRMPEVMKRVRAVRAFRAGRDSLPTQALAETPTHFHVENMPDVEYLLIPKVSSERRRYIPIGRIGPQVLTSDLAFLIPGAALYHFGVLTSTMHMAWVRTVGGRLKSDFRYSKKLIYNNFPWPVDVSDSQREAVEAAVKKVLEARKAFPDETLAGLYDPLTMPRPLARAHTALDRIVERLYRRQKFDSDRRRVEFLFDRYQQLTAPLLPPPQRGRRRSS